MAKRLAQEIYEVVGSPEEARSTPISRDMVKTWMASNDLDALGAVHAMLHTPQYLQRISPPIEADEGRCFVMHYFERCLRENPDSEWASTRYEAGWELASWFSGLWDDPTARQFCGEIKDKLAQLYRAGDKDLQRALVDAALEHMFERRDIAAFFEDWKNDPVLAGGYREALLWSEKGGKSDLHPGKPTR
jgi:hypothetical protein